MKQISPIALFDTCERLYGDQKAPASYSRLRSALNWGQLISPHKVEVDSLILLGVGDCMNELDIIQHVTFKRLYIHDITERLVEQASVKFNEYRPELLFGDFEYMSFDVSNPIMLVLVGSTIGNQENWQQILRRFRNWSSRGSYLLIDLVLTSFRDFRLFPDSPTQEHEWEWLASAANVRNSADNRMISRSFNSDGYLIKMCVGGHYFPFQRFVPGRVESEMRALGYKIVDNLDSHEEDPLLRGLLAKVY